jgi:hypothetical protein
MNFINSHPDLNTPEMITLLSEWQNEAVNSWMWEEKFFKYLWFGFKKVTNRTAWKLTTGVPNFLAKLTNSKQSFWGVTEWLAEKQETKDWKILLASTTSELASTTSELEKQKKETEREKKETADSIKLTNISRNISNILQD